MGFLSSSLGYKREWKIIQNGVKAEQFGTFTFSFRTDLFKLIKWGAIVWVKVEILGKIIDKPQIRLNQKNFQPK